MKLNILLLLLIPLFVNSQNYTDENGLKQGKWIKHYYNKKIKYIAIFKDGKPIDTMKRFYPNGKMSVLMVFDKTSNITDTKIFDEEEEIFAEGRYIDKKKDGLWKYYGQGAVKIYSETYKKGLKHGESIKYYRNKKKSEKINFAEGKKQGEWLQFYDNGNKRLIASYKDNKLSNSFIMYYSNGKIIIKGEYENNQKIGTWDYFKENGELKYSILFKNGEPINIEELLEKQQEEFKKYENTKYEEPDLDNFFKE